MHPAVKIGRLLCILAVAFLIASACSAQEYYTKYYVFENSTPSGQTSVTATTFGYEFITGTASEPWGTEAVGFTIAGGVFSSTITGYDATAGSVPVGPGGFAEMGWTTGDLSCYLWDLRWGTGDPVIPEQLGGAPGGGSLMYIPPEGFAVWTISNALNQEEGSPYMGQAIDLSSLEVGVYDGPLPWSQRSSIAMNGIGGVEEGGSDLLGSLQFIYDPLPWANLVNYVGRSDGFPQSLAPGQSASFVVPANWGDVLVLHGAVLGNSGVRYLEEVSVTPELSPLMLLACGGLPVVPLWWRRRTR